MFVDCDVVHALTLCRTTADLPVLQRGDLGDDHLRVRHGGAVAGERCGVHPAVLVPIV